MSAAERVGLQPPLRQWRQAQTPPMIQAQRQRKGLKAERRKGIVEWARGKGILLLVAQPFGKHIDTEALVAVRQVLAELHKPEVNHAKPWLVITVGTGKSSAAEFGAMELARADELDCGVELTCYGPEPQEVRKARSEGRTPVGLGLRIVWWKASHMVLLPVYGEEEQERIQDAINADVLVIDDADSEARTDSNLWASVPDNVLDERYGELAVTIISINLAWQQAPRNNGSSIQTAYGARGVDRIRQVGRMVNTGSGKNSMRTPREAT